MLKLYQAIYTYGSIATFSLQTFTPWRDLKPLSSLSETMPLRQHQDKERMH
jgi:hypothetical protein